MRYIAHRGASAHAPENTLAAFKLALEMGAKSVEFDIQQTRDGRLVVIHDPSLGRLADVRARVSELSWDQLSKLDVGRWFDARFEGERIPLLDDVIDLLAGLELHIEIKEGVDTQPGIDANLIDLLRRKDCMARSRISSFDHPTLFAIKKLEPSLRLGYLFGTTSLKAFGPALEEAVRLGASSMDISRRLASKERVQQAKAKGLEVHVYTVNDPVEAAKLEGFGVDGIFTDHPELPRQAAV